MRNYFAGRDAGHSARLRRALLLAVGALLFVLGAATVNVARAQDNAVVTPEGITADEVNAVARDLWCPLCSGVRLDTCELKACAQMRDVIAIKLGEGESPESIKAYFLDSYGPQVLGAPPLQGFNWLAWILPAVVLLVGGALVLTRALGMIKREPTPATARTATQDNSTVSAASEPENPYEQRLTDELKHYDSSL